MSDTPPTNGEHLLPTSRMWPDERAGPWLLTFRWQVVGGRAECVGIEMYSTLPPDEAERRWGGFALPEVGTPLTRTLTRSLPTAELVAAERVKVQRAVGEWVPGAPVGDVPTMRPATRRRLELVARTYRNAWVHGRHPVQAVAVKLKVSDKSAAGLVARARAAGFLPPTSRGAPQG